jgi:hypothetical protein
MRICVREPLTANRTYYVRKDGNDSNTGLVNDASGAFLTIQKAVNVVSSDLDLANFSCVIQVGAGTYAENVRLLKHVGTVTPILRGDNTTPGNVVIAPSSGEAVTLSYPERWSFQGFKITSSSHGIHVASPAELIIGNLEFGACSGYHMATNYGGVIVATGNYSISGGGSGHMTAVSSGSQFWLDGQTITLSGTPHFIGAFVVAERASSIIANNLTFTGSATGVRYVVRSNAVIDTLGAGANYFPGNSVFAPQTGGQYL